MDRSASAPSLPPVSPARHTGGGGATGGVAAMEAAKLRGKRAQQARFLARKDKEGPKRTAFLSGLLNEDLSNLTRWHGSRPHHEQRRFLRSVDTLYKAFVHEDERPATSFARQCAERERAAAAEAAAMEAAAQAAARAHRAAEEDPLHGPPRSPRINARAGPDADPTSLDRWLDGGSVCTGTTGTTQATQLTSLSFKTKTSSGPSMCSEPGTMQQLEFRRHNRALHLQKSNYPCPDQHLTGALNGGVPNRGLPESERMITAMKEQFGSRPVGEKVPKEMYESVLQGNSHPFVSRFLQGATNENREGFAGMVRSLQYLRLAKDRETKTIQTMDLDLAENTRLWKPAATRPMFDPSEANVSQVPLGTLAKNLPKKDMTAFEPTPPTRNVPPSPSVSGLGSLPLTRLNTPSVGSVAP
eukprot:TRINITY_DN63140_c0_g1_i1.p2 TRINITY_DN63140_c0_g1~~TRINITY_DN63140_c0_g1_i1.p2  ORF type:complete len:414 (+),score=92.42 TRINITY_DN63140_c0_g1_i1:92-1333(+)